MTATGFLDGRLEDALQKLPLVMLRQNASQLSSQLKDLIRALENLKGKLT